MVRVFLVSGIWWLLSRFWLSIFFLMNSSLLFLLFLMLLLMVMMWLLWKLFMCGIDVWFIMMCVRFSCVSSVWI